MRSLRTLALSRYEIEKSFTHELCFYDIGRVNASILTVFDRLAAVENGFKPSFDYAVAYFFFS
ncbi:MAG: hypothetical protein Q4C95_02970 [Planctomycetia bacterium]|nr:hypothetical protein [Planctomycetia bacterium]